MKDLDFDELDRAVNSLMTGVSKDSFQKTEDSEKTLDIPPTLGSDEKPSFGKLEEAAIKVTSTSTPAPSPSPVEAVALSQSPLATRRGGRFMDVVHPSSDMKKPTLPHFPSRQGITVEPREAVQETKISPPEPMTQPSIAKEEPVAPVPGMTEQAASVSEWPDPLEIANFQESDQPEETESFVPNKEPAMFTLPDSLQASQVSEDEPAPLVSPFLPGTKVDKRPLGTAMLSPNDEQEHHIPVLEAAADEPASSTGSNAQLPALLEDVTLQLPEELRSDLMALEADTGAEMPTKTDYPQPLEEKPAEPQATSTQTVSATVPSNEPRETPVPAGPTSIPQQYREEPNTGDQKSGAIYDTDSYHQPLMHPVKKKSGWLWVVWIVLILLLGAGSGAALYFFGIV